MVTYPQFFPQAISK